MEPQLESYLLRMVGYGSSLTITSYALSLAKDKARNMKRPVRIRLTRNCIPVYRTVARVKTSISPGIAEVTALAKDETVTFSNNIKKKKSKK